MVSFRGNQYSVPPGLGGSEARVRHRLGAQDLRRATSQDSAGSSPTARNNASPTRIMIPRTLSSS
ncbi:hypothetical protein [Amycolatopsis sp. cmx-11-12]|uniref:hypothetical protein n=1 Tax=Amycolatopsis sp. cmx-11-12 TaxID=2785795 RepID=UPI003918414C